MTNWKPVGVLSIVAGIFAFIGIIGLVVPFFIAPVGIVSGTMAIHKGHKKLGWIGIGLNILALITLFGLLYHWGWFSHANSD